MNAAISYVFRGFDATICDVSLIRCQHQDRVTRAMRALFVSNNYPPRSFGGYEQLCQEVARELAHRGHDVRVLTCRRPSGNESACEDAADGSIQVYRLLHLETKAGVLKTVVRLVRDRKRLEQDNLTQVRKIVAEFRPDVTLFWGMWNVPRSVPAVIEKLMPHRVAYYLCDYWPSLPSAYVQKFQAPSAHGLTRWPKKLIGSIVARSLARGELAKLHLEHPICVSHAVRELLVQSGVPIEHASIIPNGIKLDEFPSTNRSAFQMSQPDPLKLVYAGRLSLEKGVHTAIRAVTQLDRSNEGSVTLDLVGSGSPSYERTLRALVRQSSLENLVTFQGSVPRSQMAATLARYDALIFPSEWEEPSARIVMEAMALGLVVIGTTTGGTGEALIDGETGLTFAPGDSAGLVRQIRRLLGDGGLRHHLVRTARERVEEKFTFERMVNELESYLLAMNCKSGV